MVRRARTNPPAIGKPGQRAGGEPVDEREHFIKCPMCGHMIDMRNLGEVFEHEGPHEALRLN